MLCAKSQNHHRIVKSGLNSPRLSVQTNTHLARVVLAPRILLSVVALVESRPESAERVYDSGIDLQTEQTTGVLRWANCKDDCVAIVSVVTTLQASTRATCDAFVIPFRSP
eukprot:m.887308 g.887308  ORF g.887308 m.887308 type:complete len:111 (+) comp59917_c0_seq16:197-529(+)